jgi:glycosyltransferase involved in cell wall biosynthesis
MNNLISIITPSYNSSKFISQTIDSVLAQTYQNWEMIIVDDVSSDSTIDIIKTYTVKDSRIKLIKLKVNSGPAIARNKGIRDAKGRYIAFLDSDDLWKHHKLKRQIDFMNKNNLSFTYCSYDLINEEDNNLGHFTTKEEISYYSLLKTCNVGCLTAIYDTQQIDKIYMPNILKRQDYGLWLKILKKIKKTKGITESLAIYRIRKNSVSSNKFKAIYYVWKIYREVEKLSLLNSSYYMCYYIYNRINKY